MSQYNANGKFWASDGIYTPAISEYSSGSGIVISGTGTFAQPNQKLTGASNQLVIQPGGAGNSLTLTAANPASASRTLTLPDPGGNDSVVYLALNQTLTNKTLTSPTLTTPSLGVATATSVTFGTTALNYYEEGTHVTNWTGIWAAPQAGTLSFVRVGKSVTLTFPDILSTASVATFITNSVALPVSIRPSVKNDFPVRITDNGTQPTAAGLIRMNTDGSVNIYKDLNSSNFTAANSGGLQSITVHYRIT